jgi:hypothetical protein
MGFMFLRSEGNFAIWALTQVSGSSEGPSGQLRSFRRGSSMIDALSHCLTHSNRHRGVPPEPPDSHIDTAQSTVAT